MLKLGKSYRLKVALWSCLVSGLVLLVFLFGMAMNLKTEFAELVDHDMEALAVAVLAGGPYETDPFLGIKNLDDGSYRGIIYEELDDPERNVVLLAVVTAGGDYSFQNEKYWDDSYADRLMEKGELELGVHLSDKVYREKSDVDGDPVDARWVVRKYCKDASCVYLGINQHENKDEYIEYIWVSAAVLPFAFVVVAVGGWWIGVYAVEPVRAMSRVVSAIEANDLGERVPHSEREDEMGQLARLINDMLERIERGYDQSKRFTADASHELRTPLAILQGELEARMRESGKDIESDARMLEEIRRLKALTHSLLFLSKADSSILKLEEEQLDFYELTKQIARDIEDISTEAALVFDISVKGPSVFLNVDRSLIQQSVMNLLRNAVKFNRMGGAVACRLSTTSQYVSLVVANNGETIPVKDQGKIFERFYRGGYDRDRGSGGFGLGLNIAREIVRAHGGDIVLLRSGNDWTEFELRLPV